MLSTNIIDEIEEKINNEKRELKKSEEREEKITKEFNQSIKNLSMLL